MPSEKEFMMYMITSDRAYVTSVLFEFFILIPQITQISNTERY